MSSLRVNIIILWHQLCQKQRTNKLCIPLFSGCEWPNDNDKLVYLYLCENLQSSDFQISNNTRIKHIIKDNSGIYVLLLLKSFKSFSLPPLNFFHNILNNRNSTPPTIWKQWFGEIRPSLCCFWHSNSDHVLSFISWNKTRGLSDILYHCSPLSLKLLSSARLDQQ